VTIVHNLSHLGIFPSDFYRGLHLPEEFQKEWFPTLRWRWSDGSECMNFLKAGLSLSSAAALVSPSYARETQTRAFGCGMDEVLRALGNFGSAVDLGFLNGKLSGAVFGIVNGVDADEWNPESDPHVAAKYSSRLRLGDPPVRRDDGGEVFDAKTGKALNKRALQVELGLDEDPDAPLIGFIGRLDAQKGVDELLLSVPRVVARGAQVVFLGSGDPRLEEGLRNAERQFRGRVVGWVGFSVPVSHRITAAVDILAMPSRFEPCGLNQLYALRYGSLPVAHATGGLRDTVTKDVGFPFSPCNHSELTRALEKAMDVYRNEDATWQAMRARAMRKDLTWNAAAEKYEKVFAKVSNPPPPGMNAVAGDGGDPARAEEDVSREWLDAEHRAEKRRQKAVKAPNRDTREGDSSIVSSGPRGAAETLRKLFTFRK
jgi:starch synthase